MPDAVTKGTPFRLRCLGPVTFTAADGGSRRFRTRKQMGLLLVLARRAGRPHGREQLVELLWSDVEPRAARHSLAQSISLINKVLGREAIELAGKDQVRLREGVVWVDADAFEQAAQEGRYAEARALWRGNLLEGLWVQRAPGFEAWIEAERQRLTRLYRGVLHAAVDAERAAGNWSAMRATAESLLESDPLDEAAMLAYLEAVSLGGDRTLALRRYGEFEARLKDELDAEPGAALKAWIRRQRRGDELPATVAVAIPRVAETQALPTARPVYGREEEFKILWDAWTAAQQRQGSFIILEGPAGIGKSALAGKLANQAHVMGGAVCFVRCWRTEKSVPFAPITALIRQLMRLPGFVALNEVWIGELSRLVPELRERYPNAPAPMAVDDAARHRVFDGILQAASCVADEQPLMIIVDDVHDADDASLALVHYLGRQAPQQPVLIVCATRGNSVETEVQRAFFEMSRSTGMARFLQLPPLSASTTTRIIRSVLASRGIDPPEWVLHDLVCQSDGNPLHTIEAATAVSTSRKQTDFAWTRALDELGGSRSFEVTAVDRLRQLSPVAQQLAAILDVAGRALSDYEFSTIAGLPTSDLALGVSELEGANFVRRTGNALALSHERYEGAISDVVTSSAKAEIHRRFAELLAKSAAENPAARYEVARHFELAGMLPDAAREAEQAARYARSMGAMREQAFALSLAARVGDTNWRRDAELAHCLLLLQEVETVRRLVRDARTSPLPEEANAEFAFLEVCVDAKAGLQSWRGILERLLTVIQQRARFKSRGAAYMMAFRAADRCGNPVLARRLARRLRKENRSFNEADNGYELAATAYIRVKYYWPEQGLTFLQQALAVAQNNGDLELEKWCHQGLGAALSKIGRFEESAKQYDRAIALARRILDLEFEATCLSDRAVSELALGKFDEAERSILAAEALAHHNPAWHNNAYFTSNWAVLHLLRHDYANASAFFESAYTRAISADIWAVSLNASSGRAICAARQGNLVDLARWADMAEEAAKGIESEALDRSLFEIARAWRRYLVDLDPSIAIQQLRTRAHKLRRRDVEDWLLMELEAVRINEHASGRRDDAGRAKVRESAQPYKAGYVIAEAT